MRRRLELQSVLGGLVLLGAFGGACGGTAPATEVFDDEAALVANFNRQGITDLTRPTHIIIVGNSDKLGTLVLHAAVSRARRYVDLYPGDQIIFLVTADVSATAVAETGATVIRREGLGSTAIASLGRLGASAVISALDRFSRIESIDFYGHSSPFGALLEASGYDRILSDDLPSNVADLTDNFDRSRNPYVTLNGCNGGVYTAPALSRLWRVPVSGALTASNFEILMNDGRWYVNDEGMSPGFLSPASVNDRSFEQPVRCRRETCVRMKPDNHPYVGVWSQPGGLQYGLNYYKFFCDFEESDDRCAKGMATSLLAWPSVKAIDLDSSDEDIEDVLADHFCGTNADVTWFDRCKAGLLAAAHASTPFSPMRTSNAYSLECDFRNCDQEFRCESVGGVPQRGTCAWVDSACGRSQPSASCKTPNVTMQTTNREFMAYREGIVLLRAEAISPR